jgi:hypothetical protein
MEAVAGRPHLVAEADSVAIVVVILPAFALKVGRNRLWHLRRELAAALPAKLRHLVTRGRTGNVRSPTCVSSIR